MTNVAPETFREVFGHLPTGVSIVTAFGFGGPVGMAANSVTSVSLDPPLLLICPAKSSTTWPHIRAAGRFCVNVAAAHHEHLCRQFARTAVDRFDGVPWHPRAAGPALDDAVAWIDCVIDQEHDAGDHTIVVAAITGMGAAADSDPLVFHRGRYGSFGEPEHGGR
jgi:3-hydroxy-9,10-secoandrosta-1,3,5(10)-triene-9,17-dione monooxygenase reductase component